MKFTKKGLVQVEYSSRENEAVKLAVINLRADMMKVLDSRVCLHEKASEERKVYGVQNGPCTLTSEDNYTGEFGISKIVIASKANFIDMVPFEVVSSMPNKKEAYSLHVINETLYLCGADKRGTVYAIYEFSKMLGVSPFYFFADVPIKRRSCFELTEGFVKVDYPSVEYRGIFINDEEELEKWAQSYMGEETIGVKTYEKVFELLLRLKLNYLWPAMHVNSFNMKKENGALAEKMGIVIGTSHCDMLMRSNNREWEPWKKAKGYTDAQYDFSIEGENREHLIEYWKESVEQNSDFEVTYTLGMRGIHDSGFETKTLEGLSGEALLKAKIELLTSVIDCQKKILREVPHKEALKIFVPYKEVLELYDNGLSVPEDLTLIWTNDNYGYVRRYPDESAAKRPGGNGIYYHQSYWAPPQGSYLFINSCPLAQIRYELKKAYDNGICKLWVTNFGAIKPLEQQLAYYADLAFNVNKDNDPTIDVVKWLEQWINETFSGDFGAELSKKLTLFDQVVNMRKVELLENDVFYQSESKDEAFGRICFLKKMFDSVNQIYEKLPKREQDAFFQLVLFRVHAAFYANAMHYYADKSFYLTGNNDEKAQEAQENVEKFDVLFRKLIYYYNNVMSDGKWYSIVTPEDFPPPRTAMYPVGISKIGFVKEYGFYPEKGLNRKNYEKPKVVYTKEATSTLKRSSVTEIPYLGRGYGSLMELEATDGKLTYGFEVSKTGDYTLSIERYPSLNSVGEISAQVSLDGEEKGKLVASATDEKRGNWKQNILDNVDWMELPLGCLSAGHHEITLSNATKYFALSRIHLYMGKAQRNHVWAESEMNPISAEALVFMDSWFEEVAEKHYKDCVAETRPEIVTPVANSRTSLVNEDICVESAEAYFGENSIIPAALALLQNDDYYCEGSQPDFGFGVNREHASLYYRFRETIDSSDVNNAVYSFDVETGDYIIWACVYSKGSMDYDFRVSIDSVEVFDDTKDKMGLWKYSAENVYMWIPLTRKRLVEGKHKLSFTFGKSRLRLEQIAIQKES